MTIIVHERGRERESERGKKREGVCVYDMRVAVHVFERERDRESRET